MYLALLIVAIVLLAAVAVLQVLLFRRPGVAGAASLGAPLEAMEKGQDRLERTVKEEIARNREEFAGQSRALRQELSGGLKAAGDSLTRALGEMAANQHARLESFAIRLDKLTESNQQRLDGLKAAVEQKLGQLQEDNARKLEEMRKTVDEKLQGTLERRLGESFKLVSDRLEQVHKGLGEVQTIASGVGDLKKMLANVKVRGTWGEMQLGNLLEQMLSPEQYARNVATRPGSNDRVEFAIRLPGKDDVEGQAVWLPIDAKFPMEDYLRLVEASERSDPEAVEVASRQIEQRIKLCARDIRDKYLHVPETTDFGIMFLPAEGLYAEVLRRPGLIELLQRELRVSVAGPTTLVALLNSLQMGFRTLAIQKRSSEVWAVLGAVKTEFARFGEVIGKVHKKLEEASHVVETAAVRTRAIERKLRDVQELPTPEAAALLGPADGDAGPAMPPAEPHEPA